MCIGTCKRKRTMTITYNAEVATIGPFGAFWKLLRRWRGSIYKLVIPDMALYIFLYYSLNLSYTYIMNEHNKVLFRQVVKYCQGMSNSIPMSFVLGFYVSIVVQRWWDQYICLPWPDALAVYVSTNIQGTDDRGRLIRRTIMRHVNLAFVYTMSQICTSVKKRFPTLESIVEAGIMTEPEKKVFEEMNKKTPHMKYWMPAVWAGSIVVQARKEGRIRDDFAVKTLVDSINAFRGGLGGVLNYDWISVPLVYTQTVTLAVYTFFMAEMMGRQFVKSTGSLDLLVPIYSFLSFFFYMGWLRVAETLFNPFGDDDDDFEINWFIDRNLQVSYIIVDQMHEDHPELVRDQYWEVVVPKDLPYTEGAEQYRRDPPEGSAVRLVAGKSTNVVVPPKISDPWQAESKKSPVFMQVPQGLSSARSSLSDSMLRSVSPSINPVTAGASSLPVMSPRGWAGSRGNSVSEVITSKRKPSFFKRSLMTVMSKISSRVAPATGVSVVRVSPEAHPSSATSLSGGGDSEAGDMFMSHLAVDNYNDMLDPEPPATVKSLHESPSIDTRSKPSHSSQASMHSTIMELDKPKKETVEDKGSPKFLPGEYNFLVTPMEEEEKDPSEETPAHDSGTVLLSPRSPSQLPTSQPMLNPNLVVTEADKEHEFESIIAKVVQSLMKGFVATSAFAGESPSHQSTSASLHVPGDNSSVQESARSQLTSQSVGGMPSSREVALPITSTSTPSQMTTKGHRSFWLQRIGDKNVASGAKQRPDLPSTSVTTDQTENSPENERQGHGSRPDAATEMRQSQQTAFTNGSPQTKNIQQSSAASTPSENSLSNTLPLSQENSSVPTAQDVDLQQSTSLTTSATDAMSSLTDYIASSIQEITDSRIIWPPLFSHLSSQNDTSEDGEAIQETSSSTEDTSTHSTGRISRVPGASADSTMSAAPSKMGVSDPPRSLSQEAARLPSGEGEEEERPPSRESEFSQGFIDPDDAESSSSQIDFTPLSEDKRPFY